MNNETKIMFPVEVLSLNGEPVEIRELHWPDAVEFLSQMAGEFGKFVDGGSLKFGINEIMAVVLGSATLSESLMLKSTGKPREWLHTLSVSQALAVLDVALKLNLSDDLLDRAKKVVERLRKLAPAATINAIGSSISTTSSSGKVGADKNLTDAPSVNSTFSPEKPISG